MVAQLLAVDLLGLSVPQGRGLQEFFEAQLGQGLVGLFQLRVVHQRPLKLLDEAPAQLTGGGLCFLGLAPEGPGRLGLHPLALDAGVGLLPALSAQKLLLQSLLQGEVRRLHLLKRLVPLLRSLKPGVDLAAQLLGALVARRDLPGHGPLADVDEGFG